MSCRAARTPTDAPRWGDVVASRYGAPLLVVDVELGSPLVRCAWVGVCGYPIEAVLDGRLLRVVRRAYSPS